MRTIMFPYHILAWAYAVFSMRYVPPTEAYYLELVHSERHHREILEAA